MKMSAWSLACQQSKAYFSDITVKDISKSCTHKMAAQACWHCNYVTVTLCIGGQSNEPDGFSGGPPPQFVKSVELFAEKLINMMLVIVLSTW